MRLCTNDADIDSLGLHAVCSRIVQRRMAIDDCAVLGQLDPTPRPEKCLRRRWPRRCQQPESKREGR